MTTRTEAVRPAPDPPEHVDVLVVGSGFGGSVAAYRMADAGRSVVLFERGKKYGPGEFARTPAAMARNFWDPSEAMYGLFDAWSFRGAEGLVSSGLGGGSLIYANVFLRKDEHWFVQDSAVPGGGYENWPINRQDLEPHYDAVEKIIQPVPYPYRDTAKTMAMESAARGLDLEWQLPPLAVTFSATPGAAPLPHRPLPMADFGSVHGNAQRLTCNLCGECDLGCNGGAKNTLDHTYLSRAEALGADIRTLHEVRGFRPRDGGGWEVRYVVHTDDGQGVRTRDLPERMVHCEHLMLGAGAFGTTFLLLRNRASLGGISPALGSRFSGNGDLLTVLLDAKLPDGTPRRIEGSRGPVITSAIRVPDAADGGGATGRGYYVEDAGFPGFLDWLVEVAQIRSLAGRAVRIAQQLALNTIRSSHKSNISADLAAALGPGRVSSTSVPLLGMGRDVPDGTMSLQDGRLAIDWTLSTSTGYFDRVRATMEDLAEQLGARFADNPLWWAKRVITVHPLGGSPMGRHPGEGVCDAYGEVFGSPGLYVVDGSAMPGPVGANPAFTIAAMADRACTRILEQPRRTPTTVAPQPALALA